MEIIFLKIIIMYSNAANIRQSLLIRQGHGKIGVLMQKLKLKLRKKEKQKNNNTNFLL